MATDAARSFKVQVVIRTLLPAHELSRLAAEAKHEISTLVDRCRRLLEERSFDASSPVFQYVMVLHWLAGRALECAPNLEAVWNDLQGGPEAAVVLKDVPRPMSPNLAHAAAESLDDKAHQLLAMSNAHLSNGIDAELSMGARALHGSVLRRVLRREHLRRLEPLQSSQLLAHADLMRGAFSDAREASTNSRLQVRKAFELAFTRKRAMRGRIPALIVVHDVDCDLCPEELVYPKYPNAKLLGLAKRAHDLHQLAPWEARFAVAAVATQLDPRCHTERSSLLRLVGQFIYANAYPDAQSVFRRANAVAMRARIQSHFCTANDPLVVAQLALELGAPQARIWAVDQCKADGWDKPTALTEIVLSYPDALVLCSDDSDPSLVRAVERNGIQVAEPSSNPAPCDLVFFSARLHTDGHALPLQAALTDQRIPSFQSRDNGLRAESRRGYQGVREAIDLYIALVEAT